MQMKLEKELSLSSVYIDSSIRLGTSQTFLLCQDGFTECFGLMGMDGIRCRRDFNAFWVITKAYARFYRRPRWEERIRLSSFPIDNERFLTHISTQISDMDGKPLIEAVHELCLLDISKRRPLRLSVIGYPEEGFCESAPAPQFSRFPAPEELKRVDGIEQKVYSQFIDMSGHMNNVEYIRLALDLYSDEWLASHEIAGVELRYTAECREGQTVCAQRYVSPEADYCLMSESGRSVFGMKTVFSH